MDKEGIWAYLRQMNLIQSFYKSLPFFVSSLNMTNCKIKSMSDFSNEPKLILEHVKDQFEYTLKLIQG
jgi:hypothetical protein